MIEKPIKVVLPMVSLAELKVSLEVDSPISKIETLGLLLFSDIVYADFNVFKSPSDGLILKRKLNWIKWKPYPLWIYTRRSKHINDPAYNVAYNLMEFARQERAFIFFTDWGEREEVFVEVTKRYPFLPHIRQYIEILNRSMLIQNILGFLIFNELTPNIKTLSDNTLNFISKSLLLFKEELQDAILYYSEKFKGQYYLNQQNKEWLKEEITRGQNQVLHFLSLENAKPDTPDYVKTIIEFALSYSPISPVLPVLDVIKKFRKYMKARDILKTPQAKLGWATLMMKKFISYLTTINEPNNCIVCSLTLDEIQNLSNDKAEEIIRRIMSNSKEFLCENHMIAWLDIRKQYALTGKELLIAMKQYYSEG